MPKYRKKIWSGDVYEIEEYFSPRTIGKNYEKSLPAGATSEEQALRNLKIARKKLTRLINTNFNCNDYFVVLTYDENISLEESRKALANFFRRLKRYRIKEGYSPLKYISVTEIENRIHHHLLINNFNKLPVKEVTEILFKLWGNGLVFIKKLFKGQTQEKLANYITKENIKPNAKRWSQSRNLKQPKIKVEEIKGKSRKLKAPKGYSVIYNIENYYTEIGYLRYLKAIKTGKVDLAINNEDIQELII